ncbi:MAG: type II toxin-antitoxin system VapC family toxin [Magnetococcales bacterium]|nr:type II toxin-antitoxin system VapC family toxin [Magnetococcales bacterium]
MKLIVDASVALKWFLSDEPGAEQAVRILETEGELLAPEWIVPEVSNAVWKMIRSGRIGKGPGEEIVSRLPRFFSRLIPVVEESSQALAIALRIDHPIYDCYYLALAERENVPPVTADGRLVSCLTNTPWAHRVISLEQWGPMP